MIHFLYFRDPELGTSALAPNAKVLTLNSFHHLTSEKDEEIADTPPCKSNKGDEDKDEDQGKDDSYFSDGPFVAPFPKA